MRETILQFGAGNFLRSFVDTFVHEMNAAGQDVGKIVVAQSTEGNRAQLLNEQGGRFHIVVRGIENGVPVDRTQEIASISRALGIATEWDRILAFARSPDLRAVVSNTTEAGYELIPSDADKPENMGEPPRSFPGRLLTVLRRRYEAGLGGLVILPCELFGSNADRLYALVYLLAKHWDWLDLDFRAFLNEQCVWVNTLVDRIASGKPPEHPLLETDPLLTATEPYAFWAVEDKPGTEWLRHPAIQRVADVEPFALRKVRILNGAHTALVEHVRRAGRDDITLVRQAVADPEIGDWLRGLLFEEIVPTIADRVTDAEGYANQTLERFANPFLDHKLADIALHHETKVQVRLIPTRDDFRRKFGREPERLSAVLD